MSEYANVSGERSFNLLRTAKDDNDMLPIRIWFW